ncbi:hypothetical protein [Novosphingobium sp.]|uniref:hypothetical protein n=1 Tax=Novosphingobium sp. TaxID=1874826 RepID=UPI003B51C03C
MSMITLVPGRPGQPNAFRRNLPGRVQDHLALPLPRFEPEVEAAIARGALRSPPVNWRRITRQDARDFLLAYCACFIALQMFLLA